MTCLVYFNDELTTDYRFLYFLHIFELKGLYHLYETYWNGEEKKKGHSLNFSLILLVRFW